VTRRRSSCFAFAAIAATVIAAGPARADPAPRAWIVGDGARIRQEEIGTALSHSERDPVWRPGLPVRLAALRAEVVAFQVVVESGDQPLSGVTVELSAFDATPGASAPVIARFVEHYVEVKSRSRNEPRREESLGWSPSARPPDAGALGWVPDALIPVEIAPSWDPYPLRIAPHENGAIWIDVAVPKDARPGPARARLVVASSAGGIAQIDVELEIKDALLPYRPVSFFTYYDPDRALPRLGDVPRAERQLWQLLHQHHVDALGTILSRGDAERLKPALDGSLFTSELGYEGPGAAVPPAVVAVGVYGQLGEPRPEAMATLDAIAPVLPSAPADVFVYAVDEQCDSPRGPGWRRLLQASKHAGRIGAAHTCDRDPRGQDVDIVMAPANAFVQAQAEKARAAGKRVWIYNGWMPKTGTMHLDAPYVGLMANGWIAASRPVGRWFLWESTFWHDTNRGGHGAVDPFVEPENFHNQDGDSCLGEGLLVYPGTQAAPFAAHSIGLSGVLPSMRLKMLRRGIQDAGYYALARTAAPAAADAIVARLIPAALDEVPADAPTSWPAEGAAFAAARASLRALIPNGSSLDEAGVARALEGAHAARPRPMPAPIEWFRRRRLLALAGGGIAILVLAAVYLRRRARKLTP